MSRANTILNKFLVTLILICVSVSTLFASDFVISFTGNGASNLVESVEVQNLTKGITVTIPTGGVLNLSSTPTGILEMSANDESVRIYPNPILGIATLSFYSSKDGNTQIDIYSIDGRKTLSKNFNLKEGENSFQLSLPKGIYILKIVEKDFSYAAKAISQATNESLPSISFIDNKHTDLSAPKKIKSYTNQLFYTPGDHLLYKGVSGSYKTVVADVPAAAPKTVNFDFMECKDALGNNYTVVTIGSQTWMVDNLNTTKYRTGENISNVTADAAWSNLSTGAYCDFNNTVGNSNTYGKLYNWYAVTDSRNIAPAGWHIPTEAEWITLSNYLGGEGIAGGKLKESGTNHWSAPNASATNESGFTALPGGFRIVDGSFCNTGYPGGWWSANSFDVNNAWYRYLYFSSSYLFSYSKEKQSGFSVRCVKDLPTLPILSTTVASSISSTGATSGGSISSDGGAAVTERGICWSSTVSPTIVNSKTSDGAGTGTFSSIITGLTPGTTYYLRAYATNSVGTSYGTQVSLTTTAISPTLTTTAISAIAVTTATSGGNITSDGGAAITARGVCWSTTALPTTTNNKTTDGIGAGAFTSSITSLTAGTTYYLRAYAINIVGTSYGEQVSFTTTTTLPTITTNAVSAIAATTATSGGIITSDGGATISARGVCWSTTALPTTANTKTTDGTGTGALTSIITGLSAGTTYYLRAYATNSVGTSYGAQVSFTTPATLPTLTTTAVSAIAVTTATSGGNITSDGGAAITARGVCWSTSALPTTANSKTTDGIGAGAFTSNINSLSAGTTYYLRAYATNSAGTSYGAQVSFTSLTTPTLTTTVASTITNTTANSGGTITTDGGAAISARGVCWSTMTSPTITDSKTTDGTGVGAFTSSITGLTPGTTYYLRAYASNSVGTSYGAQVSFTTPATLPTLTTTVVSAITATTATSGGNITSDGGAAITTRGVCWSTTALPTTANSKTTDGIGAGAFTSNISSLSAGTTYYLRAYATNSSGTSYGAQVSFTTLAMPTLTTLATSAVTNGTATSGGNITADFGLAVTARGVCWSTTASPTTANNKTTDGTGTGIFTSNITGLLAGTTYYVRAYAVNSAGTSYGAQLSFTTLFSSLTPPSLTTSAVSAITYTTATSGGNITTDGGALITARGVCWSTTASPTTANNKTTDGTGAGIFTSNITGLLANTTYYIRAYATNSKGTSYGAEASFKTYSVIDADGNGYTSVVIGTQTWMVENLKTTKYNDGTAIPNVTDNTAWSTLTSGAWCNYENDAANGSKNGKLYNWFAVNDGRKIAPAGWHVATDAEWTTLINDVTANLGTSISVAKALATTTDWTTHSNAGAIGCNLSLNNYSGFSALPAGSRSSVVGNFSGIGVNNVWWTTDVSSTSSAWGYYLLYSNSDMFRNSYSKSFGFPVRCVKDNLPTISSNTVSLITSNTATAGGNITGYGSFAVTSRGVCWSTSASPTITNSKTTDGTGIGAFTSSITGLTAGTTYYARAYATNSLGTAYGNEVSFTTLATNSNTISDIDGNVYNTVTIGTQTWMAENLKTTHYRDGTLIPNITANATWAALNTGAWCDYSNLAANCTTYGHLYNWYAITDPRNIAPLGWHIPTDTEWTTLTTYLGGESLAGGKLKETGTVNWASPNTAATNEIGFSALPGGCRYSFDGTFYKVGSYGYWWSSTEPHTANAWGRTMNYVSSNVSRYNDTKSHGYSVRCIKDILPTINSNTISLITTTTAIAGGNVIFDGDATVTSRGVCWSTTATPTIANSKTTDETGTGIFTSSITGLTAGTTYYVRAYATNSLGTSYGSQVSFTTTATLPTLTTAAISSITATTANSGGTITADGGAVITARGVCWSTTVSPTTANSKTTDGTGVGAYTSIITDLSAATTYYVRAYATNSMGTAYGNEVSFTTTGTNLTTVVDIDGNIYHTVTIGTQTWMIENLKTTHYRDGTLIPNITVDATWAGLTTGAWCDYNNDTANDIKYGKLYNWYAVSDSRNIAPLGWHVASHAEWTTLTNYATANLGTSGSVAKALASTTTDWVIVSGTGNIGVNLSINNYSGFNGLPGGNRYYYGEFTEIGYRSYWWSSTESGSNIAKSWVLSFNDSHVNSNNFDKTSGYSVRCVKDLPSLPILSTNATSPLSTTTATSGGSITADGGSAITARGVCWSTTASPTTANSKTTDGTGTGIFTSSITGLSAGTTYYVRAYATNSLGTAYGNEVSFTTASLNLGDTYAGGLVFYIDNTGKHGKVCSIYDQASGNLWADAVSFCNNLVENGFDDWSMSTIDDLALMKLNLYKKGLGNFNSYMGGYYWSLTPKIGYPGYVETENMMGNPWYTNMNTPIGNSYNARAVRAF